MQYVTTRPVLNVEEYDRLSFMPYMFGMDFMLAESQVYALAKQWMPEYSSEFWHFIRAGGDAGRSVLSCLGISAGRRPAGHRSAGDARHRPCASDRICPALRPADFRHVGSDCRCSGRERIAECLSSRIARQAAGRSLAHQKRDGTMKLTGIQLCTAERFVYAQDRECIKAEEGPVWHKY